ncbi:MAG: glycoside-pentoside-hexuronide (GPH):cation symporter [Clostridiales bacterium]|jgi:sugar (glycoside-pentoside-hexuronide) transporter|nr:glycoside-pentoside-hexuronide (GPH):cation symporter [Clostridiales bacterium]
MNNTAAEVFSPDKKYLKPKDYVTFSMAKFAASAVVGLTQGYLLIFYTSVLGIAPVSVGLMFLIAKVFDGLNDPFMGVIVDRTKSKWGKMRPYLFFGAIPFGIITVLLFLPVGGMPSAFKTAYMYVTYIAYGILGTMVGVPLDGLPAVASPNNAERIKIISVSRIIGSIGEQSALVLYSVFILYFGTIRQEGAAEAMKQTYMWMGIIIGVLAPIFMIAGAHNVKERIPSTKAPQRLTDGFRYLFKNKQFAALIASLLISFFRNLVSAAIIYMVTYVYSNGSLNIFFALPGAVASMVGMLLAPKLRKKFDSRQIFIASTIVHSAALFVVFLTGFEVSWVVTAVLMAFAMFPVGLLNVVPHFMAIDTLDYWEDKTGERNEGITFALISLRGKVSSAFKDFVLAGLLSFFLFTTPLSSINGHSPYQLAFTKSGIFMIFTIIPAVLNLLSALPLLFYKLNAKKMKEITDSLKQKREKAAVTTQNDKTDDGRDDSANGEKTPYDGGIETPKSDENAAVGEGGDCV